MLLFDCARKLLWTLMIMNLNNCSKQPWWVIYGLQISQFEKILWNFDIKRYHGLNPWKGWDPNEPIGYMDFWHKLLPDFYLATCKHYLYINLKIFGLLVRKKNFTRQCSVWIYNLTRCWISTFQRSSHAFHLLDSVKRLFIIYQLLPHTTCTHSYFSSVVGESSGAIQYSKVLPRLNPFLVFILSEKENEGQNASVSLKFDDGLTWCLRFSA